ncbi:MAG: CAP domain-containing protein [Crocinitomicaceae bacterium]|nr:CAP domain-containing protein [Crocinitomicaceae bacterium]
MKKVLFIVGLFLFTSVSGQVKTKEEVIELYKSLYASSELSKMPWVEGTGCSPGSLPDHIYKKVENRINFFRVVNGLSEIKVDPTYNKEAQAAAYWCFANNTLSHAPGKSTKCFSEAAYTGCNTSCLGFSDYKWYPNTAFISGFMMDFGESNYYIGHRRCILSTTLETVSYGATATTESLIVMKGMYKTVPDKPEYVAYPWHGYVPVDLIYPKWSFSIPRSNDVDFSKAKVKMTDGDGNDIAVKMYDQYSYQDPTLVWQAKGMYDPKELEYAENKLEEKGYLNKKITVKITGVVVNGKTKNYEYFVEPLKID